ncbi:hypothetical protein BH23THE1_BH23THE1_25560 [soil metagenome]
MFLTTIILYYTVIRNHSMSKSNEHSNMISGQSGVEWFFSGKSTIKIINFFVNNQQQDYSETYVAKESNLSLKTAYREIPELEKRGIIIQTRNVGKAKMYKFDAEADFNKLLVSFFHEVAKKKIDVDTKGF